MKYEKRKNSKLQKIKFVLLRSNDICGRRPWVPSGTPSMFPPIQQEKRTNEIKGL